MSSLSIRLHAELSTELLSLKVNATLGCMPAPSAEGQLGIAEHGSGRSKYATMLTCVCNETSENTRVGPGMIALLC